MKCTKAVLKKYSHLIDLEALEKALPDTELFVVFEAIEEVEGHEIEDGTLIVRVKPSKLRRRKNKVAYLIEMYEKAVAA